MNRPRRSGWTPERRAKHAEAIRKWAPWKKSTGPKTQDGKSQSSRNADKGSIRPALREASKALRQLKRAIKERK